MTYRDKIIAYFRMCRLEFIPLKAPGIFIPLLIAATSLENFFSLNVVEPK